MSHVNVAKQILVVGVGNEFRGDDAAGLWIARRIAEQSLEGVSVVEVSGEGGQLIDLWQDAGHVFVFDAVRSGCDAGKVHRISADTETVPSKFFNYSTHTFSVAEAVETARALEEMPEHLVLYGVEGDCFDMKVGLSPKVEQAVETVVERAMEEVSSVRSELRLFLGHDTRRDNHA